LPLEIASKGVLHANSVSGGMYVCVSMKREESRDRTEAKKTTIEQEQFFCAFKLNNFLSISFFPI
jgi:hypothetical protein